MKRALRTTQKGFTLIELMIVVAIIGILAAVALPAYQDYTAKAQLSEATTLTKDVKDRIEATFPHDGACPANAAAAVGDIAIATSITGKYVAQVASAGTASATGGCTVTATFKTTGVNSKLVIAGAGAQLQYTLVYAGNSSRWTCGTNVDVSIRPQTCGTLAAPI